MKSPITTHVLDTARGEPASGIAVRLARLGEDGEWHEVGAGTTDADGRAGELLPDGVCHAGTYRLTFDTGQYFAESRRAGFFPRVRIEFAVDDPSEHYHVPLLLSPFGYSTYRGS